MVFGGIINHFGHVKGVSKNCFLVTAPEEVVSTAKLGDSIALDGVCLTITSIEGNVLSFDLSDETLRVTTFGTAPTTVHLEPALKLGDSIGGHIINGHVHGVGLFTSLDKTSGEMEICLPTTTFKSRPLYKDCIAVNGISLTVAKVIPETESVVIALIPHTIKKTLFATMSEGQKVNIELNVKTLQRDHPDNNGNEGSQDVRFMRKAIEEGEKGRYTAAPNPCVGAVLVDPWGTAIDSGFHRRPGEAHAERCIKSSMVGCTLYVTLEPCVHSGRTPPCTDYIIERGPERVVIGTLDPDERVRGRGVSALQDAGIQVTVGVAKEEVEHSLRAYLWHRANQKTPYVVCKLGLSQDNCFAYTTDTRIKREWITGEHARKHSHGLRARSQRIVVGKNTHELDNPKLTVRYGIDVDTQPETCMSTRALNWLKPNDDSCVQVLVEGGPELEDDLMRRNLVNEFVLYRSSKILGLNGVRWNPSFPSSKWKLVETRTFEDGDTMQRFLCHARGFSSSSPGADIEAEEKLKFDSIEDAVNALRRGEPIVVMDDETRENEGDLMILADRITMRSMKTLLALTTGIVCATITQARANQLALPLMVGENDNQESHKTKFTLSVDAAEGVTTGVSAADRMRTLTVIAKSSTKPRDLVRPGHVFPLVAAAGGVLERRGHTEAGVDLARMCGCMEHPAMVISELYDHGTGKMMNAGQCRHLGFPMIHIEALVQRLSSWSLSASVPLQHHSGDWRVAIVAGCRIVSCGNPVRTDNNRTASDKQRLLLRIHSECFTGDVLGSSLCDCGEQLHGAMHEISSRSEGGIIVFPAEQEGRGIGLEEKIKAYGLQRDRGVDTFQANQILGHGKDLREYGSVVFALGRIGVLPATHRIEILTANPGKVKALRDAGYDVTSTALKSSPSHHNAKYMRDKHVEFSRLADAPAIASSAVSVSLDKLAKTSLQQHKVPETNLSKQSMLMKQAPRVISLTADERTILKDTKVCVVQAEWHKHMSSPLVGTIQKELLVHYGVPLSNIRIVPAPGSFEVPRVISHLASRDPHRGTTIYIAVGILVKGNTDHYDLVAKETTSAIMRLGMEKDLWIVNAVLACHNMTQVRERCLEEFDHCVGPHMAQAVARLSLLSRS
eukprot:g8861.t1